MAAFNTLNSAFPVQGVLILLIYGTIVRFWLRPVLSKRWPYFRDQMSAPYFGLFTAVMLGLHGMLVFNFQDLARHVAMISFFALIWAVIVKGYQWPAQRYSAATYPARAPSRRKFSALKKPFAA